MAEAKKAKLLISPKGQRSAHHPGVPRPSIFHLDVAKHAADEGIELQQAITEMIYLSSFSAFAQHPSPFRKRTMAEQSISEAELEMNISLPTIYQEDRSKPQTEDLVQCLEGIGTSTLDRAC